MAESWPRATRKSPRNFQVQRAAGKVCPRFATSASLQGSAELLAFGVAVQREAAR